VAFKTCLVTYKTENLNFIGHTSIKSSDGMKRGLGMKIWLFKIFWGIDLLICAIAIVFFVLGLADGSVSSFNIGIWATAFAAIAIIIAGGHWLKKAGYLVLATLLLFVLAFPGIICVIVLLTLILTDTKFI